MTAFLDQQYFDWLYGQVCPVRLKNPSHTYRNLFHILYTTEFHWIVPNDDNRIQDGKDLRREFIEAEELKQNDHYWMNLGCSFLELLIGLSRRLEFQTDRYSTEWFWELLDNLGLRQYNDRAHLPLDEIKDILNRVIWRTYDYDGRGGLFPLDHAYEDQREVEIWYQLNSYILERSYV